MASQPAEIIRWNQTYSGDGIVDPGTFVHLTGTVLGDVVVRSGGSLQHQGCITGKLAVEAGGSVNVRGMTLGDTQAVNAGDVTLDGYGPMPEGNHPEPIFTGPDGWHQLDDVWQQFVTSIDNVMDVAGLVDWALENWRGEPSTELAMDITVAALALTDRHQDRLWALLSAAIYNANDDLRITSLDQWNVWSPYDCRERVRWDDAERFWDETPELFARALLVEGEDKFWLAMDVYDAISALVYGIFSIGPPPAPTSIDRVEAFRAGLLEQVTAASSSAPEGSEPAGSSLTFSKTSTNTGGYQEEDWDKQPRGAAAMFGMELPGIDEQSNPVEAAMVKLNQLEGLSSVKEEVRQLGGQAKIFAERRRRELRVPDITRHLVMTGNPGTGKTTVARLLGQIYHGYGILEKPDVVSKAREDLVGDVIGATAKLTRAAFEEAVGGVLFIDEAYRLTPSSERDFGQEAVDTLVPLMEDRRGEIMVIAAGYPTEMAKFLEVNPGLAGRFGQTIEFPDYSDDELLEILRGFCRDHDYALTDAAETRYAEVMKAVRPLLGRNFDNARLARRMFEGAVKRNAARVHDVTGGHEWEATNEQLIELVADDIPAADKLVVKRGGDGDSS